MVSAHREFAQKYPVATKRALRAFLKAADICAQEPDAYIGPRRSPATAGRLEAALDSYYAAKGDELRRQLRGHRAAIAALQA